MITALVIAAAVSISSPEIGNFFDIPAWMPTRVPSDRTFGSKDMTNATHRIDDTALAAVNACFEAWCERCYFAHCGNSNVWDFAEFGPMALGEFQFSKSASYDRPRFWYSPDTNRTASTRRLVECDNINGLAGALKDGPSYGAESALRPYRPLWSEEPVYWSSTLFDGIDLGPGTSTNRTLPSCEWTATYSFVRLYPANQWPAFSMTWTRTNPYNEDPIDWSRSAYDSLNIPMWAVDRLNYGESGLGMPSYPDYYKQHMGEWWAASNTTMDVIGKGIIVTNIVETHVRSYVEVSLSDPNPYGGGSDTMKEQLEDVIEGYLVGRPVTTNSFSGRVYFRRETYLSYDVIGETVSAIYPSISFDIELPDGYYHEASGIMFDSVDIVCHGLARRSDINYVDIFPNGTGQNGLSFSYDATDGTVAIESAADVIADVEVWYDKSAFSYYAGLEGLTNDTRRLVTDSLAGIGCALSALDRTYSRIALPYTDEMTNIQITAGKEYRSAPYQIQALSPSASFVVNHVEYELDVQQGSYLPVPTEFKTNVSEVGWGETAPSHACMYRMYKERSSLGGLGCNVIDVSENPVHGIRAEADADDNSIVHGLEDYFQSNGYVGVRMETHYFDYGVSLHHQIFNADTFEPYDYPRPITVFEWPGLDAFGEILLATSVTGDTTYMTGRTLLGKSWRDGHPTYPGDYTRVKAANLWGFMSYAFVDEDASLPRVNALVYPWDDIRGDDASMTNAFSEFKYRMDVKTNASAADCREKADGMADSLVSKCEDLFGVASDPVAVYERVEEGVVRAQSLSHILPDGLKFNIGFTPNEEWERGDSFMLYRVDRSGGGRPVTCVGCVSYEGGRPVTNAVSRIWFGSFSGWVSGGAKVDSGYAPINTPHPGRGVNAKLDVWSKVDWNWKALKRGD